MVLPLLGIITSRTVYNGNSNAEHVPGASGLDNGYLSAINSYGADGTGAYLRLRSTNTGNASQSAYIGAVSTTGGAGVYTPSIVIGSQSGNSTYQERLRIDASGNVGIGTTNPTGKLEVSTDDANTSLVVSNRSSTSDRYPNVKIENYGGNAASWGAGHYFLDKARGSKAAPAAVQTGDDLGSLQGRGFGATDFKGSAKITFLSAGNFTDASSPGIMIFKTTPTGSTSTVEHMRIDETGKIGIGTETAMAKLAVSGDMTVGKSTAANGTLDVNGSIVMSGSTSGYNGFRAPAVAGSAIWTLPSADGSAGQSLSTNGAGILYWSAAGAPTVTGSAALADGNIWIGDGSNVAQVRTLTGDVSISNSGVASITAASIVNTDLSDAAVTYSKIQNVSTNNKLLGRSSAGAGSVEELSLGTGLTLTGSTISATGIPTFPLLGPNGLVSAPTYSFASNTNTGMYSSASGDLSFAALGTRRITIATTGEVGINRTPGTGSDLDVGGTIRSGGTNSGAAYTAMVLNNSAGSTVGTGPQLAFKGNNSNQAFITSAWEQANNNFASLTFSTVGNGSTAERMRINSSGNVGIGTNNPGASLDVKGAIRMSGLTSGFVSLKSPDVAGSVTYTLPSADGSAGHVLSTDGAGVLAWSASPAPTFPLMAPYGTAAAPSYSFSAASNIGMYSNASSDLSFATNGLNRMTILNSGYVGIGTTVPVLPLTIATDLAAAAQFTAGHSAHNVKPVLTLRGQHSATAGAVGLGTGLDFQIENGSNSFRKSGEISTVWTDPTNTSEDSDLFFSTTAAGANSEKVRITSAGSVGIGTTVPTAKLAVSGDMTIGKTSAANGMLDVNGSIVMSGSTSGYNGFRAPALAGSTIWTLPSADGSAGHVLSTDGAGILTWSASPAPTFPLLAPYGTAAAPSYSFTTASNVGMYSNASNDLSFSTAGANRLTVATGGNVGVNTSAPRESFQVVGNAEIGAAASGQKSYRFRTSGGALDFEGSGANMHYSVWGSADYGGTQHNYLVLGSASHDAIAMGDWNFITGTNYTIGSPVMSIKGSSGNVGIGTTVPTAKFAVSGDMTVGKSTAANGTLDVNGTFVMSGSTSGYNGFRAPAVAGSTIWTLPSGDGTAGQTLITNGSGVLTWSAPTPTFPLLAPNGTAAAPSYSFSSNTNIGMYSSASNDLSFATSGLNRMTVANNGNVGIGTTAPAASLDVSGGANFGGNVTLSATGASITSPRTFGVPGMTSGQAMRLMLGDASSTGLQVGHGRRMQQWSYWGVEISGNRQSTSAMTFASGLSTDPSVHIIGGQSQSPVLTVSGIAGQTGALQQWKNSAGTTLSVVSADGSVGIGTSAPLAMLSVSGDMTIGKSTAANGTLDVNGTFVMSGSTSGYNGFRAPAVAGTAIWTLPSADGTAGQALVTNGSGILSWSAANPAFPLLATYGTAAAPSYSFSSVTNAGMYSSASNDLSFSTNGTNRVTVANDGNVGIGLTPVSGSGNLQVKASGGGQITMLSAGHGMREFHNAETQPRWLLSRDGIAAGQSGLVLKSGSTGTVNADGVAMSSPTSRNLAFYTSNAAALTERMRIDDSGNVGIGTAAPVEKLDVNGGVKIGNTAGANAGTLRWTGLNFQGYDGTSWFNIVPNPPAAGGCDTTQTFNASGVHTYTVPATFGTITVKLWGGGGGGGSAGGANGSSGGASTILSLGLNAGGGAFGSGSGTAGAGGTGSGGTVNTSGIAGTAGVGSIGGNGGGSPNGGIGGPGGNSAGSQIGFPGTAPGGAGGGGDWSFPGGGGGGGAYVEKTFTPLNLSPNAVLNDLIVGAAGGAGIGTVSGGAGAVGQISITCTTAGAPPVNDRSIVFQSAGSYSASSTFVYDSSGNVGIGTAGPTEKLEVTGNLKVTGQSYSARQTSAAASPLTFNADSGNVMVWTNADATPTANIHNMKPGGSYMLVVQGAGTGAVTLNCYSDAGVTNLPSGFMPPNAGRVNSTLNKTVYTVISDGTNCLVTWITGF